MSNNKTEAFLEQLVKERTEKQRRLRKLAEKELEEEEKGPSRKREA